MIWNEKLIYIVLLVIVFIVFIYCNQDYFFPVKESALFSKVESAPQPNERDAYNENKGITSNISSITNDRNLDNVDAQINDCQKLIDEINSIVPRSIGDISIQSVIQTDNLEDVKIEIKTLTKQELDPITNNIAPTSKWHLYATLPRGKQGPSGIQGEKGETGEIGETGKIGEPGQQGPWGKDCDKC